MHKSIEGNYECYLLERDCPNPAYTLDDFLKAVYPSIQRWVRSLLPPHLQAEADDLTQTVAMEVWAALPGKADQVPNIVGWLRTVTRQRCLNYINASRRSVEEQPNDDMPEMPHDEIVTHLSVPTNLTQRELRICDMLGAGDTERDIAASLGVVPSTAHKAIIALRKKFAA